MIVISRSPIARIIAGLFVAILVTGVLREVRSLSSSAPDFPCNEQSGGEVEIAISQGQTGSAIAKALAAKKVVKSSESFFRQAVADFRATRISPGIHRVNVGLCARQALDQLLDPKRIVGLISISEGMWVSEVLPQMHAAGFLKADIQEAIANSKKPRGFKEIEGLLFPAQYSFAQGTSAQSAIGSMLSRAEKAMKDSGFYATKEKFTPQQLLVIASLIQAEGKEKDFAQISQVIRNRLKIGMPLQFDSTVHFVKKSRGTIFLSTQSTLISSPYNTYRRYGLPPGPINNPGQAAMRAAVTPQAGDWLYFITVAPSDTRFTSDVNQFSKWKIEYKKNLRAGKFRSSE
ncbi:MAG: endolytic transglycosylase MltG [Actinobacteria bacterium]|nr:endolytic transglycosylase MltG [Actinomycetota bacterium]